MASYPPVPINPGYTFTSTIHHDTYPAIDSSKADLSGKYVFITGASKGVGRTTALSFARAGAEGIALGARSDFSNLEAEIQSAAKSVGKKAPKVLNLKLDVIDRVSVENAAKETEKVFGKLDILINNAGYLSGFVPILEQDPDEWWMNWDVNLRGVYWMTRAFLPLMLKGGDKTIINMSSIGAQFISPGASGYQGAKFALLRFTEHINVDYGEQGLLAYCIHPAGVMTELAAKMPKQLHSVLIDKPELAGDALVSLASERREWLAGRYVSVNWDLPELYSRENEIVKEDKLVMRMKV